MQNATRNDDRTRNKKKRNLISFLYNNNPFYLISAGVVLFGCQRTFDSSGSTGLPTEGPWTLAGVIAGYTVLLAATAWLIVRFGKVWDDARSIMMVLLLLFFALSVSFDSLCVSSPTTAVTALTLGFCFVVVVTELLLASLRIRLPSLFKGPFYMMLGLSFFYPLLMPFREHYLPDFDSRWLLPAFPLICGLAILSLLPAIRRGRKYVTFNGTPWSWPMFPFAAFVLLVVGLCGRTVLFSMAFDPSPGEETVFSLYFLAPIILAALIVVLELGIIERKPTVQALAMFGFPLSVLPAINWEGVPFTDVLTSSSAAPVWLMLIAVITVYAHAARRGVGLARWFLVRALIVALFVKPDGAIATSVAAMSVWPLLVLAAMQLSSARQRKLSWNWLAATGWLCLPVARFGAVAAELGGYSGTSIPIGAQWLLLTTIVVGFVFTDRIALVLRIVGAFGLPLLAMVSGIGAGFLDTPLLLVVLYPAGLCALATTIYFVFRDKLYLCASALIFGLVVVASAGMIPMGIAEGNRELVLFLSAGLVCFVAGVFVSCLKGGLAGMLRKSFNRMIVELKYPFAMLDESPPGIE